MRGLFIYLKLPRKLPAPRSALAPGFPHLLPEALRPGPQPAVIIRDSLSKMRPRPALNCIAHRPGRNAEFPGQCDLGLPGCVPAPTLQHDFPRQRMAWPVLALIARAVTPAVKLVLRGSAPGKVHQAVVKLSARTMACLMIGRSRSRERLQDQVADPMAFYPPVLGQVHYPVAPGAELRPDQPPPGCLPGQGHDVPQVTDLIPAAVPRDRKPYFLNFTHGVNYTPLG